MPAARTSRVGDRRGRTAVIRQVGLQVRRRVLPSPSFLLVALAALTAVISLGSISFSDWVPVADFVLVLIIGGYLLRPRQMALLYVVVLVGVLYSHLNRPAPGVNKGVVVVLAIVAALMWTVARDRARLGLQGLGIGEGMLVDLRDRLRNQGRLPPLPRGWRAETVLRSAYGDSFSGDFLVASCSTDGRYLEAALVDVSGKGTAAGTRSLLLSGAFGGLLGAMPAADFLPSANQYLLRQRWHEGFATAVHLQLDLVTGAYRIASAGHPPAAHFRAGSGRWELLDSSPGPLLGVLDDGTYPAATGTLKRGDALLLYTDGVVEIPGRDLDLGIDRMLGHAERLVRDGFAGGARRIVDSALAGETDDRAVMLLWRQ